MATAPRAKIWWIEGIETDADMIAALRYEADQQASASVSNLLSAAADRLEELSTGASS